MEVINIIKDIIYEKKLYEIIEINCDELKKTHENPDAEPDGSYEGTTFVVVNIPYQIRKLLDFVMKSSRIYGYCPHCQNDNILIFDSKNIIKELYDNLYEIPYDFINDEDFEGYPSQLELKKLLYDRINVINTKFTCGVFIKNIKCPYCKKQSSITFMMNFVTSINSDKMIINLQKIGQYPQLYKWRKNNKDFDKVLDDIDAKEDYRYAIMSGEDGYYIGAYTYLRRVLEKYLLKKYKLAVHEQDKKVLKKAKDDKDFEKMPYEEKKDLLKDYIVDECKKYGKLYYENVSAGIHKFDEVYCKENYNTFINALDIIIKAENIKRKIEKNNSNTLKKLNEIYRDNNK